jgi:hypothetical protein
MLNKFLIIILFLIFPTFGWSANYYVDFVSGADTSNGTATGAAFKHCPGDPNATNTAASTTLAGDDFIYFKGGVTYDGYIQISWSGTSGHLITYDGNSSGTWGTGKAIITNRTTAVGGQYYGFYANEARNYITIKYFEFYGIGGFASWPPDGSCPNGPTAGSMVGSGVSFWSGGTNIIVQDSYFHEIGAWMNTEPATASTIQGVGVELQNVNTATVNNCEFTRMHNAVGVAANGTSTVQNVTISNNNIHNYITWGIDIRPRSSDGVTISNIYIYGNSIHNMHEFDTGNWAGCDDKPHVDGVFLRTSGMEGSTWSNINIYNNFFYSGDSGNSAGGTACIYISQGPSARIYNNVFVNIIHTRTIGIEFAVATGTVSDEGAFQYVRIMNNTFYDTIKALSIADETNGTVRKVYVYNNVFYNDSSDTNTANRLYLAPSNSDINIFSDYNLFYNPNYNATTNLVWNWQDSVANNNIAAMQALTPAREVNSVWGNPIFVDSSRAVGATAYLNNYHLQTSSPAKDVGATYSSFFTMDKDEISRPQGAAWDIGAYEYQGNNHISVGSGIQLGTGVAIQ